MTLAALSLGAASPAALTGPGALGDWHGDAPGVRRHIAVADLPPPHATRSVGNAPSRVPQPAGAAPRAPDGFAVTEFAKGMSGPRLLRVAPNGDVFVSETEAGRVRVLRAADGKAFAADLGVFARLDAPFGIAFYPPGPDPQWIYVADINRIVRFPYRLGDTRPRGPAEIVVSRLTQDEGGHSTRDIAFSPDGARMFVSVGSGSNDAEGMQGMEPAALAAWRGGHAPGAAWGRETDRADVLSFDPQGGHLQVFATGLRNCVGMAVQPATGALWCATNERDGFGDNLPPDYVTHVQQGKFYGWPWFYIGDHSDPRHPDQRPDLATAVAVPDVLIQPHSAPLQMTFYAPPPAAAAAFPASFDGDAFVALHGSWNRAARTGYKVVRLRFRDGSATGEYDDFVTGFVVNDNAVWGRPVGVAVAHDGALLVSDDASGTIWRVAPR